MALWNILCTFLVSGDSVGAGDRGRRRDFAAIYRTVSVHQHQLCLTISRLNLMTVTSVEHSPMLSYKIVAF